MDPAGDEAPSIHTVGSAADWVVVEGADNDELTSQAYSAFRERILPLMPMVNQMEPQRLTSDESASSRCAMWTLHYLWPYFKSQKIRPIANWHAVNLPSRIEEGWLLNIWEKIWFLAPSLRFGNICH
jgi:hypothetical protein